MSNRAKSALTRKELYHRIWSKPMAAVASELGVSGNALAKICNRLLVPYPRRGHWMKVGAGRAATRPELPCAPESDLNRITISSAPSQSRRFRTRLKPSARRENLLDIAKSIVLSEGMSAATLKRVAAQAGISETQVYNYFAGRDELLIELARTETARLQAAQQAAINLHDDHYGRIVASTRAYLRENDRRGALLQMLMTNPGVRTALRADQRKRGSTNLYLHAHYLVDLYDLPLELAVGVTAILSRLCGRAGKLVADKRASLDAAERLCLAIVLHGSRRVVATYRNSTGTQGLKAA
jgi:AcrR family transcriptional regulator